MLITNYGIIFGMFSFYERFKIFLDLLEKKAMGAG